MVWTSLLRSRELRQQATADIANIREPDYILVPPSQIRRGGHEPDDKRAGRLLGPGLPRPGVDLPAIGRVHEYPMAGP